MKTITYPERSTWENLIKRATLDSSSLEASVSSIMEEVRVNGDQALVDFSKKFDKVEATEIKLNLAEREFEIDPELADAIKLAATNIEKFHQAQKEEVKIIETTPGVNCWRKSIAIQKVGLYIPGGSAPLFSTLLMLAIPAKIAGCKTITICTPPESNGSLNEVIGWTCRYLGINEIYLSGGAQAIAAMTYGTATIPQVDKIFGPGNQYVTAAKQLAQQKGIAIDMPAGPSEVLVIADYTSDAEFVAADLLSQAEHGPDSQVVLVSDSEKLISEVEKELTIQLEDLPRKSIAKEALQNSQSVLVRDLDEAVDFSNTYAPEHLIIATSNNEELGEHVTIAGSVFLGNWSCESAGDYASGTNHTLPTNGYARNYSGVSLDSFIKKVTFQKLSEEGIKNLGPAIEKMAEAEQLQGHKNAVSVRLRKLGAKSLPPNLEASNRSRGGDKDLGFSRVADQNADSLTKREKAEQPLDKEDNQKQFPLTEGARGRNSFYNKNLKEKAKKLRNDSTIAEATLWKYVLRASELGYPFRRQRPIGNYIVDFVSLPLKLIIEVDGITHSYEETVKKDEIRQKNLEDLGFRVVRIADDAILSNVDRVRNHLLDIIKDLPKEAAKASPQPPRKGEVETNISPLRKGSVGGSSKQKS